MQVSDIYFGLTSILILAELDSWFSGFTNTLRVGISDRSDYYSLTAIEIVIDLVLFAIVTFVLKFLLKKHKKVENVRLWRLFAKVFT